MQVNIYLLRLGYTTCWTSLPLIDDKIRGVEVHNVHSQLIVRCNAFWMKLGLDLCGYMWLSSSGCSAIAWTCESELLQGSTGVSLHRGWEGAIPSNCREAEETSLETHLTHKTWKDFLFLSSSVHSFILWFLGSVNTYQVFFIFNFSCYQLCTYPPDPSKYKLRYEKDKLHNETPNNRADWWNVMLSDLRGELCGKCSLRWLQGRSLPNVCGSVRVKEIDINMDLSLFFYSL